MANGASSGTPGWGAPPAAVPDPAVDREAWRQKIGPLDGLPLLAIKGKQPFDAITQSPQGWQTARFPAHVIAGCPWATGVGTRTGVDADGLIAFDLDGDTAQALARAHGCDPDLADTWAVRRDDTTDRLKKLFTASPEQAAELGQCRRKCTTKDPITDELGKVIEKGEGAEVYHGVGQVLLLGNHPDGGQYIWRDREGPDNCQPLPDNWFRFALMLKEANTSKATGGSKAPRIGVSGWGKIRGTCPICGRNSHPICSTNQANDRVSCYDGVSFSYDKAHPGLKVGQTVRALDGRQWALTAISWNDVIGADFGSFKIHEPLTPDKRRSEAPRPGAPPQGSNDAGSPQDGAPGGQQDGQEAPQGDDSGAEARTLTTGEKLKQLEDTAAQLLADRVQFATRLPILRAEAEALDLTIRDQELQAILTAARRCRSNNGQDDMLQPGDHLDLTPEPWAWDGLVLRGALNLWVALPKVGKTSLALAWLNAWYRNEPAFLDRTLIGPCPPVMIVGTDQGQADWGRMLQEIGWVDAAGKIGGPLKGLVHAGRPLHLDPEGIDRIAAVAQKHPGLVVLVDSLSACLMPLGLKEETAQIVEPVQDLMEQLEPHGATLVVIHHASKGRAGEGASSASRGSTALPAAASQILKLAPASASELDHRRLLTTQGRGGLPQTLVIQRDGPTWNLLGGAELLEQEQTEAETIKKLNDRQADALDLVWERWREGMERTAAADLAAGLAIAGKDAAITALKTLKQLERKGLLNSIQPLKGDGPGGRPAYEFWPVSAARVGLHKTPAETAESAETSPAPEDPERSNLSPVQVSALSALSAGHSIDPVRTRGGPAETPPAAETPLQRPFASNAGPSATDGPPYWLAVLQQLATAYPDDTAAELTERLWSGHGVRTTEQEVTRALAALPPATTNGPTAGHRPYPSVRVTTRRGRLSICRSPWGCCWLRASFRPSE